MDSRTSTFLTTSALVLALALALVGPAQAMVVSDGDGGGETAVVIPNDRDGQLGVGSVESQSASAPDWFERAAQRGQQTAGGDVQATSTIPYLSHGQGVDTSLYGGNGSVRPDDRIGPHGVGSIAKADGQSLPSIPYLSQGDGVDESLWSGASARPDDRSGTRGAGAFSEPQPVFSPTTADDGFDWQTIGFGAGAFLLALCAAALMAMTLGSRRTPAH